MIPSTIFAFVVALSSLVAVNGAVVRRDGTFTYVTPQPTSPLQGASTTTTTSSSTTTSRSSSATSTPSTTPTITSTITPSTTIPTTSASTTTQSTSPTSVTVVTSGTITPCSACPPTVTTLTSSIPVTTTATPPPGAGSANCDGVQQWQASFAYNAGDRVIFNNQLFTARQWTDNNAPPTHPDQWTAGSTCAQPVKNNVNCNGVAAWQSIVAYTAGNRVTFNGHLWSAVQWTQSNTPGDTSGLWKDLGACA